MDVASMTYDELEELKTKLNDELDYYPDYTKKHNNLYEQYEEVCEEMNKREKRYKLIKEKVKEIINKYTPTQLCVEIYNLFQEYLVDEHEEEELYYLVDPYDDVDSPGDKWYRDEPGVPELYEYAVSVRRAI